MTNKQMLNLDRAREFKKTILEDIEREVKKIPTQYGDGSGDNPKAVYICHNILQDLRKEMAQCIEKSMNEVDKFIESL